ncbi:MAG: hypothetical protein LBT45_00430, partial [Rickettsiales bacterium]|nr:hypothetical protein [Rickettsiales bacterium]
MQTPNNAPNCVGRSTTENKCTSCAKDYYFSNGTCTECPDNSTTPADNTSASCTCIAGTYSTDGSGPCTACVIGSYNDKNKSTSCTACDNGSTTKAAGSTSCDETCPNRANASAWSTADWVSDSNTITNLCTISKCGAGYDLSGNKCEAATYAVTLDANDGTDGTTTSVTATYYAVLPAVSVAGLPKRAGHTFNGYWSAQSGGTQYIYAGGAATENEWTTAAAGTIYAQWAACGGNNYYCSGAAYNSNTEVSSGYYSTGGTDTTRTGQSQCSGAYWCSGGVRTECPAQTTGWTRNTGAGWTAFGSCNETKTGTAISAYCNA